MYCTFGVTYFNLFLTVLIQRLYLKQLTIKTLPTRLWCYLFVVFADFVFH